VGWRLWRVGIDDDLKLRLRSLYRETWWTPAERTTATCSLVGRERHEPAEWDCICGIYAYKEPYRTRFKNDAFYRPSEATLVVGTVKLWGHVIEAGRGYRAQHAYPDRLYVVALTGPVEHPLVQEMADELARAYRTPASVAARWDFF
jgi:hypothetical protein